MLNFIQSFIKRKGHLIFGSQALTKIIGFLLSVFVIRYISKTEFGYITYAKTIMFFILPFIGLGLNQSLLRYGSITGNQFEKKIYFDYSLKWGTVFSLLIVLSIGITAPLIISNIPGALMYLLIISFSTFTLALFNSFSSYLRITNLNKGYSYVNIFYSLVNFFTALIFTYFFKGIGFVLATVLTPLLVFIWVYGRRFFKNFKQYFQIKLNFKKYKSFINYGLLIGIGSMASQISLMTDNILIGNIIKDPNQLAVYRTGSLIPFNLFFLPLVFMTTDFVKIASESVNKAFLKSYYFNYIKLFGIISVLLIGGIYIFSKEVVNILFSQKYIDSVIILRILLIGLVGSFMLRIPLGNILNAVGKAKWNTYNAYFMLIFNLIITYFLVVKHGIIGAAIATSIMLWVSGLISLCLFLYYLNSLKKELS